ncbi:MAG: CotH kinase family protein [Clostridia bacterium]|nr:CotH kinase family protein [Clostridia bacterium]
METKKQKPLITAVIASFLLFVIFLCATLYFYGVGAFGGAFLRKSRSFLLTENGVEVMNDREGAFFSSGEHTFKLKNGERETLCFLFLQEGELLERKELAPESELELTLSLAEGYLSLAVLGEKHDAAYLADAASAATAASLLEEGGDLVFYRPTALESLSLRAPFRLFGDFSFSECSVRCEGSGRIVLFPDRVFSGDLYVSAPDCKLYSRRFEANFSRRMRDFYLTAKSWNGKSLHRDLFPVENFSQLSRLASEEAIPSVHENATVIFTESFPVEHKLSFGVHLNLVFEKKIDFSQGHLEFASDTEGSYRVEHLLGTAPSASNLRFFAPCSDVFWSGEGALPIRSTVERVSNIRSYNGERTTLGGTAELSVTLTLLADNEILKEDAVFSPEGNLLVGFLPFSVSAASLKDCRYTLSCEGGEAHLEGDLPTGRIVATDGEGRQYAYGIFVAREKYEIPVLYIETEGGAAIDSRTQYISATFALDGEGTEIPSLEETHIRIRGRGNSTWKWEKKPYKIHFDEATSLLGLPAGEEWALFANYADKSLMRNQLAQAMASTLSFEYCPTQEFVDLFVNGEYLGVYTLGEHLEEGEGRIEVTHDLSQLDCGFFMEAGGVVSGVDVKGMNYFHAGLVKFVLIKGPDFNGLTSEQFDYINQYLLKANEAVLKGEGYEEYLDMDTLVDWLIMIELTNNTDCAWRRSTYLIKDAGEKVRMGPVWDFDLAFGNFSKDVAGFNVWVSTSEDDYVGETWSTHLLEDPEFQERFKNRWNEMKNTLLSTAMTTIDENYARLSASADENFERWDILGKKVAFERFDTKYYTTYSSQIHYLKDFLRNRAAWIDSQIADW